MKYLAVDLGNVICNVNFDRFTRKLSKTLNLTSEDVNYFLHRTLNLHDLGITRISDELIDHFKIKSPVIIESLVREWNKVIKSDRIMINFLINLLDTSEYKIALLSNIGFDHAALLKNILGEYIYNNSVRFFSCEVEQESRHIYIIKHF